ncbi:MAG: hypothetical protein JWP75_3469 [Frondihabitans sp.]|nr:hypothetical protein [Frondihabitans sp.]
MLFFAAAILYSSVHVLGVTGMVSAPTHSVHDATTASISSVDLSSAEVGAAEAIPEVSLDVTPIARSAAAVGVPVLTAPEQGIPHESSSLASCGASHDKATLRTSDSQLDSSSCLLELATASSSQLATFGRSLDVNSGADVAFATHLGEDGSATATAVWWATLPTDRRATLTTAMPGVVGNLEGVPYADRDVANRLTLHRTLAVLEKQSARPQTGLALFTGGNRRLTMLQQVDLALDRGREQNGSVRQLVSLDTVFPGTAAISVGDLDTAENVSLMVPGMLYTVSNQITFWTDRAAALQSAQTFWSNNLATATSAPTSSAVVAWMGYRTPDLLNVLSIGLAQSGAVHLEDTVLGVDAVRQENAPRVTVIAHSYGSTAATIALSSHKIHVDDLVVLGSPGSVVPTAAKLAVTSGNVYAAAAPLDPVAGSAVFGADPGATAFGATLLNVGAGTDPFTEQALTGTLTHNSYFVPGSQSMRNLALIGIGRGDLTGGRVPDPTIPQLVNSPTLAYVRPQDVYRD